jgi:DNA repair protein RadC
MKRINVYSVELVRDKAALYDIESKKVNSPDAAYDIIEKVFSLSRKPNEHFGMLALNTKNEIVGAHLIFAGSVNSSVVHPREVFQRALLNNATSIIVFHNHPSGKPDPSREDIEVSRRLQEAGRIVGIELLDHIIIGDGTYYSLKAKGHMA